MRSADIDNAGPIAEGMINQQTTIAWSVSINGNVVEYNKYNIINIS